MNPFALATWMAIAVLGLGSLAVFVLFLLELRRGAKELLGEKSEEP